MHAKRPRDPKTLTGLGDNAFALGDGERFEGLIFKATDGSTFVVVAYPALKGTKSTAAYIGQALSEGCAIEGTLAKCKARRGHLASRNGWNKDHFIAVGEWCAPIGKLAVDGYLQHCLG